MKPRLPAIQGMGLRDLADEMFSQLKESNLLKWQAEAFSSLPVPVFTPADTYSKLVHNEIELVAVDKMAGRVLATGVVPYPPGIPMLMPGENSWRRKQPLYPLSKRLAGLGSTFPWLQP